MKSGLRNPKTNLELAVLSGHLRVAVLGCPPLPKEAPSIVAII